MMRIRDHRAAPVRWLDHLEAEPEGLGAAVLAPLGAGYAALAASYRRVLRPDRELPALPPSIGVGNLRVGGTGKTPVVADLADRLRDEGWRVGILTRGYRGDEGADEPGWLAGQGHQVVIDADRRRGHAEAARRGCDVVLLDDAMQCRDRPGLLLALVLEEDLRRPPRPLPAGPARESPEALDRAACWLVRRSGWGALPRVPGPQRIGIRLAAESISGPDGERLEPARIAALGPVLAVSGLARPQSFESDLLGLGADLRGSWRGPDHWRGERGDRADMEEFAGEVGARTIVCPEKNLVRLAAIGPRLPIWCLRSRMSWETDDPLRATGVRDHLEAFAPLRGK